jgi:hypothetical protein
MKELEPQSPLNIVHQKEAPKQYGFVRSITMHEGHSLFEFNMATGELTKLNLKKELVLNPDKTLRTVSKVNEKAGCLYLSALNERNAWKHLARILRQLKAKGWDPSKAVDQEIVDAETEQKEEGGEDNG